MALIRIDVPGYEYFNSFMGTLEFKDGVSVREPSPLELRQIGANIKIVEVGSDEQVGPTVAMVDSRHVSAVVEAPLSRESETAPEEEVNDGLYTLGDLEGIADAGGIKAIRQIADEFGVKGVQISALIEDILKAQAEAQKAA